MAAIMHGNEPQFLFNVAGTAMPVVDFTAMERISSLFEVDLTLASEDEVQFDDVISQPSLLTIRSEDSDRFFHGIVNKFVLTGITGRFYLYQARMVPFLWLLSLEQDCRIFQNKTTQDIVSQLLEESGITGDVFEFRLQNQYTPREYCVQYRETDLNFVSRLLEEDGIFYFFEHLGDKHKIIFGDSTVNYQPISGEATVLFNPTTSMVPEEEAINRFVLSRSIRSGKVTLRDFNFEKPDLDLTVAEPADKKAKLEVYDYPGIYIDENTGKKLAQIRYQEAVVYKDRAEGEGCCPRLMPGYTFNLSGHDLSGFNQEYLLAEVLHNGSQPQVLEEMSTSESGSSYANQFLATPSAVTFRPERKTPKPIVEGVQTAIVTGPSGEEIYTDEHGRIKVQFHWDREGKKDENSSCWMRVSQVSAGAGWGAIDVPRIGHEVIVDFMEGDPDCPIVTGRVYHGTNRPPFDLPDSKMVSGMKSNTTPGGGGYNEISMNDTKGKEGITIHGQYDMNTTVENDQNTTIVSGNRSVTVKSGTFTETIQGDTNITIKEGTYHHDVAANKATYHVAGALTENYDDKQQTTVAKDIVITSNQSKIHITAATDIHLKVGASELQMKSDGSIKLKGVDLAIDGVTVTIHGVNVTSKADALNETKGAMVLVEGAATATVKGGMVMLNP